MKRILSLVAAMLMLSSCGVVSNLNSERLLTGGM